MNEVSVLLKQKRKNHKLTQKDCALKAGVGLRFIRDIEQGKESLRMDKVNQVLQLFGHTLMPLPTTQEQRMRAYQFQN